MKILLSILLTAFAVVVSAQEVEVDIDSTYFHPAASMYVQGNSSGASNLVFTGLSQFPENGKLLRLKELLDKQQEQNEDQNKDQDQQDQDQEEQDPNEDQQDQDQQNDQNQDQQDQDQQDQEQDQPEDSSEQEQQPPSAEQMSQDEAERLLDAMKQEEETKRLQLHPVMGAPVKVDKDW